MHIILFILCWFISIFFFLVGNRFKRLWMKRSFKAYSFLFIVTSFIVMSIYLSKEKEKFNFSFIEDYRNIHMIQTDKPKVSQYTVKGEVKLEAPLVKQLPELPRGCEVTSLAMLLQFNDINVDKMELATKIKRNPAQFNRVDGEIHFGSPYNGFVGDMYSFNTPGLGVYHGPIAELAYEYVGDRVYDLTGKSFSKIIDQLNQGRPVWVIINATYNELPEEAFVTWHTEDGPMKITMREHSVLITGYDHEFIYFNDPLNLETKAPIEEFKSAWKQMGKQAITIK